jgi:DNA-binding IclR family transcriptional regulator
MKESSVPNLKHTIPAVNKALELVRVLANEPAETTTKALAFRLGVPRTTCYRILRSLVAKDWVRPVAAGRHELSLGLLPLVKPLRGIEQLAETLQPVLETLAQRTQLTAKLSVHQGDYAVTIGRVQSPQETSVAVKLGAAFHLAYGSSGACFLSGVAPRELADLLERAPRECWALQKPADVSRRLKELKAQGWCADLGTFRPSFHAVSAPLRDRHRRVVAALTIIGFPNEVQGDRLPALAKHLLDAVRQAEKELRQSLSREPSADTLKYEDH